MTLLKKIFEHEVFPAVGCTEPISCAYAAASAAERLGAPVVKIELRVDPGTFKNGAAVTIPNSGGSKGNLIAAALGAMIARPKLKMEILREVSPEILTRAKKLVDDDGVLGRTAEESILNLSRISLEGMQLVDSTVVHILQDKTPRSGQA